MPDIPFARPDIGDREISAVVEALRSGWLTQGPATRQFESMFGKAVHADYAVALSSCTAAMHLALLALGIGKGDEVILPTMTFAATAEVVVHTGAKPVLIDVDPLDHNIRLEEVEKARTKHTRCILPVDFGGHPSPVIELAEWARDREIAVVEDAAHAFPAKHTARSIGSIADVTCFSFYATKTLTCGEGGMATTQREDLAKRIRLLSLHGISSDAWSREANNPPAWKYEIMEPGWKYNLADPAAAMGLVQLERADEMWARRRAISARYQAVVAAHDALECLTPRPECDSAWHLFVIKIVPGTLSIDRDRFAMELRRRGVCTSLHFIPLHVHAYYRATLEHPPENFPVATDAYLRSVSLPIYSAMSDAEVDQVVAAIEEICHAFHR